VILRSYRMGYSQLSLRTHSQEARRSKRSKGRTENNIIWFILCHGTSMKWTQTNSQVSLVDHSKSEFFAATGPRQKRCVSSHPSNSHTNPVPLDTQNPGHRGAESELTGISPRCHRRSFSPNPPTMNLEDLKNTVSNITVPAYFLRGDLQV